MFAKFVSALLALSLVAASAEAADVRSWANLRELAPGTAVEVVAGVGKTIEGSFVSFSDESITVRAKQQELSLARSEVTRVRRRPGSKATWIGAGIGAGAGAGIGYAGGEALANTSAGDLAFSGAFAAAGAAVGALAGALIGHFIAGRKTTVYNSR